MCLPKRRELLRVGRMSFKLENTKEALIEENIFSPLCILASFIKDKVTIGVWVYLWAFYLVPLIYISVFVAVP